jgi:hypothetical protein
MRIEQEKNGDFHIVLANGNFARTTSGDFFTTRDRGKAEAALAYLSQTLDATGKRNGAHWLKSAFGVF